MASNTARRLHVDARRSVSGELKTVKSSRLENRVPTGAGRRGYEVRVCPVEGMWRPGLREDVASLEVANSSRPGRAFVGATVQDSSQPLVGRAERSRSFFAESMN